VAASSVTAIVSKLLNCCLCAADDPINFGWLSPVLSCYLRAHASTEVIHEIIKAFALNALALNMHTGSHMKAIQRHSYS